MDKFRSYSLETGKQWAKEILGLPENLTKGRRDNFIVPTDSKAQKTQRMVIDPWPNHLESRKQSQKVIHYSDKIEQTDCMGALRMIYKPELLQYIERNVNLKQFKMKQAEAAGSAKENLMIYREAFGEFIAECSFYKPILTDIKNAYEIRIQELEQEVQQIIPLQQLNTYICLNSEKKLAKIGEKELRENTKYETKLAQLNSTKAKLENALQEKDLVVDLVMKKLAELENELSREKESNEKLLQNITDLQMHIYDLENVDQEDRGGMEIAKKDPTNKLIKAITLEQSQLRVKNLLHKLDKLKGEQKSMVSLAVLEATEVRFEERLHYFKKFQSDYNNQKDLNDRLFEKNEKLQILENIYELYYRVISKVLNSKLDESQKKDIMTKITTKTNLSLSHPEPAVMREIFKKNRDIFHLILSKESLNK